ncbi:MAG: RDD family protein [Cyanobacteria bacterium HKST-UBA02]|nr:RDD family protein [Cyanobacteria bacterium HKST-UBA02]
MVDDFNYAGFWRRLQAWSIDFVLVMLATLVAGIMVALILYSAFTVLSLDKSTADRGYNLAGIIIGALVFVAYFAGFESSQIQATPGKVLMNIKVTNMKGQRISFLTALGRMAAKFLSGFLFFLGFIIADFTAQKQALHDIIAQTLVLRTAEAESEPEQIAETEPSTSGSSTDIG